jgi:hypothetical protein
LAGWRHVAVTEHRTKQDYAECLRYLVEERYPDAERIYLVQDNLNTHTAGALYETFPPAQARTILDRLEFHPTPKHGSWLKQAEIEISVFERNARRATIDWQFTARQARIKLKRLDPAVEAHACSAS